MKPIWKKEMRRIKHHTEWRSKNQRGEKKCKRLREAGSRCVEEKSVRFLGWWRCVCTDIFLMIVITIVNTDRKGKWCVAVSVSDLYLDVFWTVCNSLSTMSCLHITCRLHISGDVLLKYLIFRTRKKEFLWDFLFGSAIVFLVSIYFRSTWWAAHVTLLLS
jgi:hypothetical protein